MTNWTTAEIRAIATAKEVRIGTRRPDGSLRRPTIIWIVTDGARVFIRSTNGRSATLFRGAVTTGAGRLIVGETAHDVVFTEADGADPATVDAAYRTKYRQYPSIVAHLAESDPRAATLQVNPA